MTTTSYWLDEPAQPFPRRPGLRPDVAVIGGGVTGCSCALHLAKRGLSVRLYEARTVAGGASGRNGGFALRGAAMPHDVAVSVLGRASARRVMELTEEGLDLLAELAGDAFRRVGSLRLAASDAERAALRRECDALAADGFAVEWVDELAPPLGTLYRGAIRHPRDGAIHPARWVRRLADHASAAGVDVAEQSPVTVAEAERVAGAVVLATDGFTSAALPELAALARPTRGQVLATEPLTELRYPRPHYARYGYDYWHQLPDGRLVLGGRRDETAATEWTADESTTSAIQERLDELVRALTGITPRVTHRWAGIWGTTPDLLPLVGRVPGRERVWVAAGYSGHGNVLGLVCGRLLAARIAGDDVPELALFDPDRFEAAEDPD